KDRGMFLARELRVARRIRTIGQLCHDGLKKQDEPVRVRGAIKFVMELQTDVGDTFPISSRDRLGILSNVFGQNLQLGIRDVLRRTSSELAGEHRLYPIKVGDV